jgi:hypothetical protein
MSFVDSLCNVYCPNCGEKGHHIDYQAFGRKSLDYDRYDCIIPKYEAFLRYPQCKELYPLIQYYLDFLELSSVCDLSFLSSLSPSSAVQKIADQLLTKDVYFYDDFVQRKDDKLFPIFNARNIKPLEAQQEDDDEDDGSDDDDLYDDELYGYFDEDEEEGEASEDVEDDDEENEDSLYADDKRARGGKGVKQNNKRNVRNQKDNNKQTENKKRKRALKKEQFKTEKKAKMQSKSSSKDRGKKIYFDSDDNKYDTNNRGNSKGTYSDRPSTSSNSSSSSYNSSKKSGNNRINDNYQSRNNQSNYNNNGNNASYGKKYEEKERNQQRKTHRREKEEDRSSIRELDQVYLVNPSTTSFSSSRAQGNKSQDWLNKVDNRKRRFGDISH